MIGFFVCFGIAACIVYKTLKTPEDQILDAARWRIKNRIPHLMSHRRWIEHTKKNIV